MSTSQSPDLKPDPGERLIGRFSGREPGPLLIVTAAVHGNEPAGIHAVRRMLSTLEAGDRGLRGDIVALVGNTRAFAAGQRFVDRDLNRGWTPQRVAKLRAPDAALELSAEDEELRELLSWIEAATAEARGEVYFVDLHTSSADGCPFLTCGDTLRTRRFARRFTAPILLGIEEQLDGSLLEFMNNRGSVTVGVEGGQHDLPSSVDHHEAALWIALMASGMLDPRDAPELPEARRRLREATRGVPRIMEVRYRHAIRPEHHFRMRPGFRNFQSVRAGEVLADARDGEIRARESGQILLPLYQGLGDDGFFVGRKVSPAWMALSRFLRHLRVFRLMPLLPGVRRCWEQERTLRINTAVARYFPLQLFHLLGYRKLRRRGSLLLVSRRRFDLD